MNAISKIYSEATEKHTRGKYAQLKKVFAIDPASISLIKPLTGQSQHQELRIEVIEMDLYSLIIGYTLGTGIAGILVFHVAKDYDITEKER